MNEKNRNINVCTYTMASYWMIYCLLGTISVCSVEGSIIGSRFPSLQGGFGLSTHNGDNTVAGRSNRDQYRFQPGLKPACELLTQQIGELSNSEYGDGAHYSNDQAECWEINPGAGYIIEVTFDVFSIEGGMGCLHDKVEVMDRSGNHHSYCGEMSRFVVPLTTPAYVIFTTDDSFTKTGFHASFAPLIMFQLPGPQCVQFTGHTSGFTTDGYPRENYHNFVHRCWRIDREPGHHIRFWAYTFNLEDSTDCVYDSLTIQSQEGSTHYCGTNSPGGVVVTAPLTVTFSTDVSGTHKGFSLRFFDDDDQIYQEYRNRK